MAEVKSLGRRYLPPSDLTFPVSTLDFWRPGDAVNRFVSEHEDGMEDSEA